ncbi:MAG: S1 RNA-binding domain-containing protein [Flavobacteriales bacterium]|nr:S1 RNA-binding domain-containing protein [Flavobacteriales bacterium]
MNLSENENYLSTLIENFEEKIAEKENHPFRIVDIRQKGFIVKIYGLMGYISFVHMPWTYNNLDYWKAVFPYLKGKVFFGKVFKYEKEPLTITMDGKVAQFKKTELNESALYKGIVTQKSSYGVFVDIGYNFQWNYGSLTGLLHKKYFENEIIPENIKAGEQIELYFLGVDEKEQLVFGKNPELKVWISSEMNNLIDKVLPVRVIKSENEKTRYLVNGIYPAKLPTSENLYPDNLRTIKKAIKVLKNECIIHCKIIEINNKRRSLILVWDSQNEIEETLSKFNEHKFIGNQIDIEIIEKLERMHGNNTAQNNQEKGFNADKQ